MQTRHILPPDNLRHGNEHSDGFPADGHSFAGKPIFPVTIGLIEHTLMFFLDDLSGKDAMAQEVLLNGHVQRRRVGNDVRNPPCQGHPKGRFALIPEIMRERAY